jgi:small subunit ribosomal protein S6
MRNYELVVILKPSLKEEGRKKLVDSIKKIMGDIKMVKEEEWGQKPLAYTIKGELAGYYFLFRFESEKVIPSDLNKKLLTNNNILRHLLLRTK